MDKITRAEVIVIVNRMLDRVPDADHMLPDMKTFADNTPDMWWYADVQEAANSHEYDRAEDGVTGIWTSDRRDHQGAGCRSIRPLSVSGHKPLSRRMSGPLVYAYSSPLPPSPPVVSGSLVYSEASSQT